MASLGHNLLIKMTYFIHVGFNEALLVRVNIGSGNGLLPDGTKPLPEPMLIDHQWGHMALIHLRAVS